MAGGFPGRSVLRARPTMRDVAALAGVSLKTVSRVVNGVSSVDPQMTERVNAAAVKLGYRPNLTASNLRRLDRRPSTVGMLVENAANPFSSALMRAVENAAHERDILVLFGSLDEDPIRERKLVSAFIDRRVDGLVIVPAGSDQSYLSTERDAGTCLVFLDRAPMLLDADAVVSDNEGGASSAVAHLLGFGHRRIAYLGDRASIRTAAQRFAGYRRSLELAHIEMDDRLVRHGIHSIDAATSAARRLLALPDPPSAIFASQNLVTIGVVRALSALHGHDRVALVGFDDFPQADMLCPGATVIAQQTEQMGRVAAERLFARLDGDQSPTEVVVLPTTLIQRGSGELTPRVDR
jgi:LacI family transcriptional regulator